MNEITPARVAVVGGGFTGLTAAYELAKAGHHVEVYEAAPTFGGLVAGFELADGFPLERAYHFLYTTDEWMIGMAEELGIRDRLDFYPSSIKAFHEGRRYGFTTPLELLSFKPLSFVDRVRTGLTGLRTLSLKNWQPLTTVTAYDWLCKVNGKRATDIVWKPLLMGKFDVYWDKVTMAWLWTRIHVRQTSKLKGEQTERLGYFEGGFRIMVDRWLEELAARGAVLRPGTPIQAFTEADGRPALVIDGEERRFDAVLGAIPSNALARAAKDHPAMTPAYSKQLTDIDYLGAALMVITTSEPITDTYWHQIHDLDAPFLVFLSLDSLIGAENTGGRYIYYIGDYVQNDDEVMTMDEDVLRERWYAGLEKLLPEFSRDLVTESHVFRFRNAQHIVDVTFESRIPAMETPLPGYFLANFSQVFPEDRGTNYAVRDGLRVAALMEEALRAEPTRVAREGAEGAAELDAAAS
ncbi:NAD(P)/FAD-dependent oxidoreductase [Demequina rhizosphaerae]|uniref:NAD(P)/FAD-dependent oxidoreductase n=1 Tax=Demequina rhizosphaerae TaxID=1638985 RepID=UPI000784D458|nr:NAD(P)/FAD-dependent oxidoreductase [Demequina rhizosphaerae]